MLNKSQIEKIISSAIAAGEIATKFFKTRNFEVWKKPDGSRVSSADIAISEFLREKLSQEFPQIPLICEEGNLRDISSELFFLIDPIDGTSSFIAGNIEFCISIALVKNKKPVFGLIFAPLFEGGKMIFCDEKNQIVMRKLSGEEKILSAKTAEQNSLRIITSSRSKDETIKSFLAQIFPNSEKNITVEKLSSAIKFFRLLEGDSDLYLHFRPSMEWDIAAGQALVELMGGKVKNLNFNREKSAIGEELIYKKFAFENQPFVAAIASKLIS